MSLVLALAATIAAPAAQAAPAPAATEAPDPARLAAAKQVLDVLMPPDKRAAMFDAIMAPMYANMRQAMRESPPMKGRENDPKMTAFVERMMEKQEERSGALLRENLPGMFQAMERAYARRFTVEQLNEVGAFFATPTGRVYMERGMTIMADPDVLAWQRSLMQRTMTGLEADMKTMIAEIEAEAAK